MSAEQVALATYSHSFAVQSDKNFALEQHKIVLKALAFEAFCVYINKGAVKKVPLKSRLCRKVQPAKYL